MSKLNFLIQNFEIETYLCSFNVAHELVNTDRKKEWKPLIPENELLNPQATGKITASPINYSSEMTRHITPPPQRNNYQTVGSRPLNKAQNVQSMGRFEQNNQTHNSLEKVKNLEKELAMMKVVVDNLQKEKELALKFNQLLLLKLNQSNGVEPGSVVEVL